MADIENDILELKFDGNGIKPSIVRASEIAELLINFEKSIIAVIQDASPEIKEDYLFISLDEIKDNCLLLRYLAHQSKKYVLPAYLLITNCFESKNFNALPNESIEALRSFSRFSKKYNCIGTLLKNGEPIVSFNQDTEIAYNDYGVIKGETVLYGEVKKAGGDHPRATFKINGDYSISFDVKKEIAIELAANLYKYISISGTAKWDKKTFRVLDFKPSSIQTFENEKLDKTFSELGNLFGNNLDGDKPNIFIN